jgi:alpha-tubulin suppressor-like RCC1 family protein
MYDRRLTWESSNPAVASAEPGGVITAIAPGTVTITARSTVVSASTTLTVLPAVAQITLASAGTVVPLGGTLQITATTLDNQGHVLTGRTVTWEAGDGTIISVDATGLATGVTAGTIILTVASEGAVATLDLAARMDGPLAAVTGGNLHSCGVTTTGHVYCWGQHTVGQLGPATIGGLGAVLVPSVEQFASLAAGGSHTCALNLSGKAFCWGYNSFGQLGAASGAIGEVETVSGGLTFSRLTAGLEYTCGLSAGSAFCWGLNGMGQLGRGTDDLLTHTAPVAVVGGHAFTSIAAGENTACGLMAGGQAWCWGSNASGGLGLGTMDGDPHSTPVHAAPALTFTAIAPGRVRTCGITTAGGVSCWGGDQLAPVSLDATTGYVEIAAGGANFCRLDGAGAVSCWGDESLGNLPAEPLAGLKLGSHHACAKVVASGKVLCWGDDSEGQLGDARTLFQGPLEPFGQP